jgi:hypothetical protein
VLSSEQNNVTQEETEQWQERKEIEKGEGGDEAHDADHSALVREARGYYDDYSYDDDGGNCHVYDGSQCSHNGGCGSFSLAASPLQLTQ